MAVPGSAVSTDNAPAAKVELEYTTASPDLVKARIEIAKSSKERATVRLASELQRRGEVVVAKQTTLQVASNKKARTEQYQHLYTDPAKVLSGPSETAVKSLYKKLSTTTLATSEHASLRSLTSCKFNPSPTNHTLATAGWDGAVNIWSSTAIGGYEVTDTYKDGHEDRISDLCYSPDGKALATASVDCTARVWGSGGKSVQLVGHQQRVCRVRFHPMEGGRYVATTSADRSWRLWDAEVGTELLLQDGHFNECYGIGFHPDGSLVTTTDFGGAILTWDLRTGKVVQVWQGHAKRVLCSEWSGNGVQCATAGDDGTVKIWDIRTRKMQTTVPAHR